MSWLPLESNPDNLGPSIVSSVPFCVFQYLQSLGVPASWQIVDVYGLEEELLSTVPQPVIAVMLLFPTSDKYEEHKNQQEEELKKGGNEVSDKVYYLKQVVSNACGTIALIHSVANNTENQWEIGENPEFGAPGKEACRIDLKDGDLKKFLEESAGMSPEERGKKLLEAEGIINTHKEVAQEGQTEVGINYLYSRMF
ncbi:hypothetical protein J437_LFUL008637 [Ladona fulva]|uniref:Ubiquitin carboxyl-terminal hydrolase n=1 Tax=Ladona fulva TaxID=123851 RepID=A0A8K0P2D2_LADFU|nr:hypothetical protein J437_LFUL008637 [Ladona fulva]